MDDVHIFVDGFVRGRIQRAAAGHIQIIAAGAVDVVRNRGCLRLAGGFEQDGAGAVAEEDAGGAIFVVDIGSWRRCR